MMDVNRRYQSAATLFDAGRVEEERGVLDGILEVEPAYPFAVMLKSLQ